MILIFRVDASIKVLEPLSAAGGRSVELELKEILRQIQDQKLKTIKGSIDERDSLQRSLEQSQEVFYVGESGKFGLVKFRPSPSSVNQTRTRKNEKRKNNFAENARTSRGSPSGSSYGFLFILIQLQNAFITYKEWKWLPITYRL